MTEIQVSWISCILLENVFSAQYTEIIMQMDDPIRKPARICYNHASDKKTVQSFAIQQRVATCHDAALSMHFNRGNERLAVHA